MSQKYDASRDSERDLQTLSDIDKLQAVADGHMQRSNQVKWPLGLSSFENGSYLLGNHLTRFYYTADAGFGVHQFGVHDNSRFDSLLAKSADNKLIKPVEAVAAMLTLSQPEARITPREENDPYAEDAAEVAQGILDLLWERPLEMDRLTFDAAVLSCIVPDVAVEVERGDAGYPVLVEKTKMVKRHDPILDEEIEVEEANGEGPIEKIDFVARIWNYFHMTPNPTATCPEDMIWIARQSYANINWVREKFDKAEEGYFPDRLKAIKQSRGDNERSVMYWWTKFQHIIPSPQYYQHGGGMTPSPAARGEGHDPDEVVLTVIDVKPSTEFPKGRTIIMADGTVIYAHHARAWSERYPDRWHPYSFFGWFKMPGRFNHVPLLTQLVPLQKKLNAIDSLTHAYRQHMCLGQWKIPDHADVPEGWMGGTPGLEIRYNAVPGLPGPELVQYPPLPQQLLVERDQLERSIGEISASGIGDPGISPSANRSGAQMQFMERSRLQTKTPMLRRFEKFVEDIAQNVLILAQEALTEGDEDFRRQVDLIMRERGLLSVQSFLDASVRDDHIVKIDIVSAQFNTPEAKAQKAAELWQFGQGQFSPAERVQIFRAMGLDEVSQNEQNMSERYARRLLSRITMGELKANNMPSNPIDMLMPGVAKASVMLPVFSNFLLSDRVHDLDEDQKGLVFNLLGALRELQAQEQAEAMAQMAAAAQAQNAPPETK
jgi:hypothetical protein